jgi:hypothetical protein
MRRALCLLALGLSAAGCGGAETPLARLGFEPGRARAAAPGELALGYPEVLRVTLVWEPLTGLPEDGTGPPLVFVHLIDDTGALVRTFDHPYPAPWRPGAEVEDSVELYQSALAPPLPAGRYRLSAGLYREGADRYPLEAMGEEVAAREYVLAAVTAAETGADLPAIEAAGDWLPVEPGADRQVLASRWLAGEGELVVTGAREPGSLWLRLWVPVADHPDARLELAEGAKEQEVRLTTPCGGGAVVVTGAGLHELELPIDPGAQETGTVEAEAEGDEVVAAPPAPAAGAGKPAATESAAAIGGACRVMLSTNFHLLGPEGGARRAVRLETVAWRR